MNFLIARIQKKRKKVAHISAIKVEKNAGKYWNDEKKQKSLSDDMFIGLCGGVSCLVGAHYSMFPAALMFEFIFFFLFLFGVLLHSDPTWQEVLQGWQVSLWKKKTRKSRPLWLKQKEEGPGTSGNRRGEVNGRERERGNRKKENDDKGGRKRAIIRRGQKKRKKKKGTP